MPFSFVDGGKPVGYAVDLCKRVAEAVRTKLGLKTLGGRVRQGDAGRPDSGDRRAARRSRVRLSTTNNAERRQKVAFTVRPLRHRCALSGARRLEIADLQGFQGKKLVSTTGTTPLKAIVQANKERLLGITVDRGAGPCARRRDGGEGRGRRLRDGRRAAVRLALSTARPEQALRSWQVPHGRGPGDHDVEGRPRVQADRRRRDEARWWSAARRARFTTAGSPRRFRRRTRRSTSR